MARNVSLGLLCLLLFAFVFSGCGEAVVFDHPYDPFAMSASRGFSVSSAPEILSFFASDLCVGILAPLDGQEEDTNTEGLFDLHARNIPFGTHIFEKRYPASTTKMLTAYVALKYGDLADVATVSDSITPFDRDSSLAELSVGDRVSLEQLLYGMMLASGADAAVAIAELVSGSEADFVDLMNKEALALGATGSHFANVHGLHSEDHYTTLYDLYLIFNRALQDEFFRKLVSTYTYTADFENSEGETVIKEWSTRNRFLTGEDEAPEGVTVIGGKTGTTAEAGYCLVLLSNSENGSPYISIVLKAPDQSGLYSQMNSLLQRETRSD